MFVRSLQDAEANDHFVECGSGASHRLLTEKDVMGFTACHTILRANSLSLTQYSNHLEACFGIPGEA
ncbi:ectoine synthase [Ensifer aridi]|uniref:ectoine synthase n=1 Tax=Ensifer aridi TaxID=1708715 RepID=UPI003B8A83CE